MEELTLDNFKDQVIDQKGLILIDCYQDYCPPCFVLDNRLKDLKQNYPFVTMYKLNVIKEKDITDAFQIQSVPYVLFFSDGHFIKSFYK